MLCVTITIVYSFLSSCISSSIRCVAIGSSAEAGSSSSTTSGSIAIARAMQSRCCWPPESESALFFRRSLTSSQSAARGEGALDALVEVLLHPEHARRPGDVVVDRLRERVRLLEDHPDPAAHLDRVDAVAVEVGPVVQQLARRG